MAAPNVNGRLHLTGVHKKPPASLALYHLFDSSVFLGSGFRNQTIDKSKRSYLKLLASKFQNI